MTEHKRYRAPVEHPEGVSKNAAPGIPDARECIRLCEAMSAFWGDSCDAPIWPGAYITEEDKPFRDLVRAAVGWRRV